MAEIVAGLVGPAIELGKCIATPIKRQFNYLCCLDSNIHDLREEAKNLENARDDLQMRITRAQNNAEDIVPQVKTWLEKADENIRVNMIEIESEITNIKSGCLAIKSRYSLSKKVKKMTEAVKQLRDGCNFDLISRPAQPASVAPPLLGDTYEFESRKHIEEDIMRSLRDEKVKMMGVCGMGGVGKTTMARNIMNRVKGENLFDETVMVAISQQVDKLRIQGEMAEKLGLELEERNFESRAYKLHARLTAGGKRILVVIDDIWEYLQLEELGIPCGETGLKGRCTILLTSRDRDVLIQMDAQPIREIQTLSKVEAWTLFKEKVGTCADDQNLLPVAQEIANECKGLPIALVNVAMVLKNKKDKSFWEDALDQLKSSNPIDLPHILAQVYNPMRLSYEFLESQHAKSIFLLCCLFPEDYNIPLENLIVYAVGLRIFETIRNLKQARNRTHSLVEMLKSRFLLLEGDRYHRKDHVKMHDVVRDVAIYIASKEKYIECSDCTWLSSLFGDQRINELAMESTFPNLRLLLIDDSTDKELKIKDNFFEGMKKLNVLSIQYSSLRSLPQTTQLLNNLQTLVLSSCKSLETISVVGKLVNLEILICRNCDSVKELPIEIGRLSRLKLLEFSYSKNLKTIAPGVVSNLAGLEELKMLRSFDKWEAEVKGKERNNAALCELQSLSSLTNLEIEVEDSNLAAEQIQLSPKMVKFDIRIDYYKDYMFVPSGLGNTMILSLPREISLANWIHECARSVECMYLRGEGSSNLDVGQVLNMRVLNLRECSKLKKLVNITPSSSSSIDGGRCGVATVFPHLESLHLTELDNLEEIYSIDCSIPEGSSVNAFKNLEELTLVSLPALKSLWKNPNQNAVSCFSNLSSILVRNCANLRNLFSLSSSIANDCLLQTLKSLVIRGCNMMEQVFLWNIDDEENKKDIRQESRLIKILFPKLESLQLLDLPNLTTFCKGILSIEFPLLTEIKIQECPQLKRFASLTSSSTGNNQINSGGICQNDDNRSLHFLCKPQKVAFGSLMEFSISGDNSLKLWCDQIPINFFTALKSLDINDCPNIKSLFSSPIAGNLVNLEDLDIAGCEKMVIVIEDEEEKLDIACCGQSAIHFFPNLKLLYLRSLPELKSFCEWRGALELPSLQEVVILECPKIERLSLGSLITPNLDVEECIIEPEDIDMDDDLDSEITDKEKEDSVHGFNDTKDLNALLQQFFYTVKKIREKKQKKKREEEEEDRKDKEEEGEDGAEKEGEREEDQNQDQVETKDEEN